VDEEKTMLISIAYNKASKGWIVVSVMEEKEESTFYTTRSDAYANALEMARNAVTRESVTVVYEGLDDLEVEQ
jgi:hypothetical protein